MDEKPGNQHQNGRKCERDDVDVAQKFQLEHCTAAHRIDGTLAVDQHRVQSTVHVVCNKPVQLVGSVRGQQFSEPDPDCICSDAATAHRSHAFCEFDIELARFELAHDAIDFFIRRIERADTAFRRQEACIDLAGDLDSDTVAIHDCLQPDGGLYAARNEGACRILRHCHDADRASGEQRQQHKHGGQPKPHLGLDAHPGHALCYLIAPVGKFRHTVKRFHSAPGPDPDRVQGGIRVPRFGKHALHHGGANLQISVATTFAGRCLPPSCNAT